MLKSKKYLIATFLLVMLTACTPKAMDTIFASYFPQETNLLFSVEERDIEAGRIIEYQVFENGLSTQTITHQDLHKTDSLNHSKITLMSKSKAARAKDFSKRLQRLEYQNQFHWKENWQARGSIVKIKFVDLVPVNCLEQEVLNRIEEKGREEQCNQDTTVKTLNTFLYYTGHEESPKVFKHIVKLLHTLH